MAINILMPALSPTMTEGNLAKWLKKEGDFIKPGEVIAEIETDKATMEVEAVDEGRIGKIIIPEGAENVAVNSLIAVLLEDGEELASLNFDNLTPVIKDNAPAKSTNISPTENINIPKDIAQSTSLKIFASPLAKRIALLEDVPLDKIKGTGPRGRIIKNDLLEYKSSAKTNQTSVPLNSSPMSRNPSEFTMVPNTLMRKTIAKRLLESKQNIPHFYLSIECELDKLLEMRTQMNENTEPTSYKLSVNDFIIKASALALQAVPQANASWNDDGIIFYNNIDVSVAVAIEGGLITPIIKNANMKSISVISNEMKDLAKRARENKLSPHEFQGGGFSISNLGMFGIKKFSAIINPPQSCILAVGASSERAVVKGGVIQAATIMDVTLSCDHRVVDGAIGANFLKAFKSFIESPIKMFV